MTLQLKKFSMTQIPDDSVVLMIAKRNSGKSFLVRDLLYHKQDIPAGTVISATESSNKFYEKFVPKIFIHDEYNETIIERVLNRQKNVMKLMENQGSNSLIDPRAVLVMDDCTYDETWTRNPNIRYVFNNGRHRKLLFLLCSQYIYSLPPKLRTNIDFIFVLREPNYSNKRRLYETFCGMFPTFEVFNTVLDATTENYECMVIDNTTKSNKLEDQVYWYKASDHEPFRFGSEVYWNYSEKHCNVNNHPTNTTTNPEEETEEFNPSLFGKKNRIQVTVEKRV